jgi:hypothetical protein
MIASNKADRGLAAAIHSEKITAATRIAFLFVVLLESKFLSVHLIHC